MQVVSESAEGTKEAEERVASAEEARKVVEKELEEMAVKGAEVAARSEAKFEKQREELEVRRKEQKGKPGYVFVLGESANTAAAAKLEDSIWYWSKPMMDDARRAARIPTEYVSGLTVASGSIFFFVD